MDGYQILDVGGKQQGSLCSRKLIPERNDGRLLNIRHTVLGRVSSSRQHIRFLQVAVDLSGERIIAGDHQGNIFMFDFEKNRFLKVCNLGVPSTTLVWNNYRVNEIIVALSNFELRCYNVVTKELVNVMKCHTSSIHSISIHGSGRYALTSSIDTTVLWDLNTFMKKRTLNGAQQVGVQKVFFLPNSNKIVSCFKDDSIFVWDCENMKCLYQLSGPIGKKPAYKCLASTNDCRVLVAGGRSRFLHLWNLDSRQLIQVIELPAKVKEVKQVEFITDNSAVNQNQLLAVLAQDGFLRFIEPHHCKLETEIGGAEQRIHSFTMSKNMRYVVTVLDNGDIAVHHLANILRPQGLNPVVRKVESDLSETKNTDRENRNTKRSQPLRKNRFSKDISSNTESDSTHTSVSNGLNMKRLKTILKGFGEYPSKYRSILQLPENHIAFSALVDKGTHNAYAALHEKYPIKSRKLLRVLQRVLSAIAHWSPIFGETDYLPLIAFPIVKMFLNNQLICFEIVATILLNWCQKWFEYFPNPPLTILSTIEILLGHHDAALLEHFIKLNISTQVYAWPLLYTLFSEILTKEQWLIVWDNIFSNHPSFALHFIVSYLIQSRQTLFSCKCKEDIEFFVHHRNAIDIPSVIKEVYRLSSSSPSNINPKNVLEEFRSIPAGQYPVFDCYPKFVVDYLVEERERIREEELEYLRQKQEAIDMKKQKELTRRKELSYYREQGHILKAEQQRRDLIASEEKKLVEQRKKLQSLRRDIALQELDVLDEVRRKFLHHQRQVKNVELLRLDDELNRKIKQREEETHAALEDAEIKALEMEAQKRNFQEGLMKEELDAAFRLQVEKDILCKQQNDKDARLKKVIQQTQEIDGEKMKLYQVELAKLGQEHQYTRMKNEIGDRHNVMDLEREINTLQIKRKDFENKVLESELHHVVGSNIQQQHDNLLIEQMDEMNEAENISQHLSLDSLNTDTNRGAFGDMELDLMSQVRDIRRKMAQRKPVSIT